MAHWVNKMDIADLWSKGDFRKISFGISTRLREIVIPHTQNEYYDGFYLDSQRQDLAEQFGALSGDDDADVDDFDYLMCDLYDWADTPLDNEWIGQKLCWIKTF
jgi:hypothetical protein